ncbi:RWP-RK domain-containing protein [Baffinella frigidus]|nr:RWP-RK domain-containing protein [Cryptophyta sp. CCMP2293]
MKRSISLSELRESLVYDGSDASSTMGGGGGGGVGMTGLRRVRSHENLGMASEESPPPAQAGGARAPILSEQDLREHFNMPLNEVAKKFGMCTTALKKLCRKYGVMQWPHRKLRSLEKKIASLRAEQRYTTDGRGHLDDEIRKLEVQREALITGTGEMPEGDPAWSPTPGSPYEDQADMGHAGNAHMMGNGGNAHRHSPTPARAGGQAHGAAGAAGGTPPASKAKGGAAGGGPRGGAGDSSSKALNLQIKTLEEVCLAGAWRRCAWQQRCQLPGASCPGGGRRCCWRAPLLLPAYSQSASNSIPC